MNALARHNANNRHYRCLRKKRKIKRKMHRPLIQNATPPGIMSTFLTLLGLMGIFIILAYFRPH